MNIEIADLPYSAVILAISLVYLVCIPAPLVFPAYMAIKNSSSMQQRSLFVGTVGAATCGLIFIIYFAIVDPVWTFAIYQLPSLKEQGYFDNSILHSSLWILDFFFKWWWCILPLAIGLASYATTQFFSKRWNRIVEVLLARRMG